MSAIRFTKMHGIGNDYVYVDLHHERVDDPAALARAVSDRHRGVGADGLILLAPPDDDAGAHVRMVMFNADGSRAEMCGNGIRCVCKYAVDHGVATARPLRVQTDAGVLELDYLVGDDGAVSEVTVDMGAPELEPARIPVVGADAPLVDAPLPPAIRSIVEPLFAAPTGLEPSMTCVALGNPHLVLFCGDVAAVPLDRVGPILERAPLFPRRINVHFVEVCAADRVVMRTWERGAGATLACGTGASAVCVAGAMTGRTDRSIVAELPGGDLRLRWAEADGHVFMTGPATEVFRGEFG